MSVNKRAYYEFHEQLAKKYASTPDVIQAVRLAYYRSDGSIISIQLIKELLDKKLQNRQKELAFMIANMRTYQEAITWLDTMTEDTVLRMLSQQSKIKKE